MFNKNIEGLIHSLKEPLTLEELQAKVLELAEIIYWDSELEDRVGKLETEAFGEYYEHF